MTTELKQFLKSFPVYHEFKPTFSALVNLDVLQARHAIYQEISEKLIFVFVLFQYEKTADLSSTFTMDLPVPALAPATSLNTGLGSIVAGDNFGPGFDLANSQVNITMPDSMSDIPQDGVSSFAFYYVKE